MKNVISKPKVATLRQTAEQLLKKKSSFTNSKHSEAETLMLIHELEVHQIELEMQNEELMHAKAASEKYIALYDFAPSGYFTLSKEGDIIELNLVGAKMLGKERSHLKNCRFNFFVSKETRPIFNHFIENIFKSHAMEFCEVTLSTIHKSPVFIYVTGIAAEDEAQCLIRN